MENFSEPQSPEIDFIPAGEFYDVEFVDYSTLDELNRNLNKARMALQQVTDKINYAEVKLRETKRNYERKLNRRTLNASGKTADDRRKVALILCEDEEDEYLAWEMAYLQYKRISQLLRDELETYNTISNNLRQQLRI